MLLLTQGAARLKNLTRLMPRRLCYWTVLRMVKAGYWDASVLLDQMAVTALLTLPPPACPTLYLVTDKTTQQKSGKKMPLAHKTRMNEFASYVFGLDLVLFIAQWGRFRIPVAYELINPKIKGHQNILFRQMLRRFRAPDWCQQVVVIADAAFASKENMRLIKELYWRYVFGLARTWKLEDGTHLKDLADHLPRKRYRRVASYNPARRRRDYWIFVRRAKLKTLEDVTVLLSKKRLNDGPKKIKLIVTNLETQSASQVLGWPC